MSTRFSKRGRVFDDILLLITGGNGSLCNAALRRFLSTHIAQIRVLSRDEKEQDEMERQYPSDRVRMKTDHVRSLESLTEAMSGADYVFNASFSSTVGSEDGLADVVGRAGTELGGRA